MKKMMMLGCLVAANLCVNGMESDQELIDKTLVALKYVKNFDDVLKVSELDIKQQNNMQDNDELCLTALRNYELRKKAIKADVDVRVAVDCYLKTHKRINLAECRRGEKYPDDRRRKIVYGKILDGLLVLNSDGQLVGSEESLFEARGSRSLINLMGNIKRINYVHFFEWCKEGNVEAVEKFIQQNPTLDINYQTKDHGTTALLHAATRYEWDVVWYLLQCGADKMIKDNYDQSLFLKSLCKTHMKAFEKLLLLYSHEEINALCKSMPLKRDCNNEIYINAHVQDVLDGKKELESKNHLGDTALALACIHSQVPIIVKLLNRGANLGSKDCGFTPYRYLNSSERKHYLFAVREALNDGPCIPVEELSAVLDDAVGADCARLIKQRYVEETFKEIDFFEMAQARIWKYVCADACKVAKIERLDKITNQPDEKRGLAALLLLPQKTLTEVNIQLALEGK